jgi:hypothetical protein
VVSYSTRGRYFVVDAANPEFEAMGGLDNSNDLGIVLRTKFKDGNLRSTALKGAEQFANVVNHFKGRIRSIKGIWVYGDNLDKVNEFVNPPHNLSLIVAVTKTWTAQQAARVGFSKVVIDSHYTTFKKSFFGNRTIYDSVSVRFERD